MAVHSPSDHFEPTADSIHAARERIAKYAVRTPILESDALNVLVGARVFIKPENLQRSGSFKLRGALNRALQLGTAEREGGIVAWSSGNHGLAISFVAKELGIKATVLMPHDAPKTKIEGVRQNGAAVRLYGKTKENREEIGAQIAAESGAAIVPPYDDPYVITGQATLGAELAEQVAEMGGSLDIALFPCSGGGLVSGAACGVHTLMPRTAIYSVEPAGFHGMALSLAAGEPRTAPANGSSICDALLVPTPGKLTFPIGRERLTGGLSVEDDEVREAIRFAYRELKLVIEPGGAVALAALLAGKADITGKTVAILLSGGNVDAEKFAAYIATPSNTGH
ncbi:putative threonine dehydratase (plasmid) [Sinorhizobium fredii NGR234]|uniref:Threonine dehydratase n=1 Tax=Sinorhizobium fredii (strain NBRC 101917 / NGR234) TaxID=394 RepID=C3KLX9_SINFN|nr:threonine/serine dehydratase [Sinorhizobium fredii]ACP23415.1 putative threonine dehydratase [Sinorhizobium fredii NGR234]